MDGRGRFMKRLIFNITAVHGFKHLRRSKGIKYYTWLLIMILNLSATMYFLVMARQKYLEGQIITELNANCLVSQVPFPAVSICNYNDVSLKQIGNIERLLLRHKLNASEIRDFFKALPSLKGYGWNSQHTNNFTNIMAILKDHYFTLNTVMEEVHQKCEDLLIFCSFNKKQKKCSDMFSLIKTFDGYCCTFNYGGLNDGNKNVFFTKDEDFDYYDDDSGDKAPTAPLIATSDSGRLTGLFIVLDVEPDEYPAWDLEPFYGAKVLISDPNDYPETTIKYKVMAPGEATAIKVQPLIFQTDNSLRAIDPSRRSCWFHDEATLELTDRYSFETCHTECKMATILDACDCLPYKYPRDKYIRICEFEDLMCLNNVTVHMSSEERKCQPICYMECSDKKYKISGETTPFESESISAEITKNRYVPHLSALRVYYAKSTCTCYRLKRLIDISYVIAIYGSVLSVTFGGSIMTLVELSTLFVKCLGIIFVYAVEILRLNVRLARCYNLFKCDIKFRRGT